MPRTIEEGFRDFLTLLTPAPTETLAAKKHRASIEACLTSHLGVTRLFRSGSFGHGTSIAGASDVDYFAEMPEDQVTNNSRSTLVKLRNKLSARFFQTPISVRTPAVRIDFGRQGRELTEIVPAVYRSTLKGRWSIYAIPHIAGGWMEACPKGHNAYIKWLDEELGGKLRPLIRFVKAWKYNNAVPVSSFYLELRTATYMANHNYVDYSWHFCDFLGWLFDNNLPAVQDPLRISGLIQPCDTPLQLLHTRSKLRTAANRASKAIVAEGNGKLPAAFYFWRLLFASGFPSYYKLSLRRQ